MTSDRRLFDFLDDLEGQAAALYAAEREAEAIDRSRAEYASVTLGGRLMASLDLEVGLQVDGVGPLSGRLRRVGTGWCLVASRLGEWLVPLAAVTAADGLSERAVPEAAWPAVSRLGLGSVLRRLADDSTPCRVFTRGGGRHEVVLRRVGADFVEVDVVGEPPRRRVLSLAAIGAVQSQTEVG
ncbi:hypothetical protein ISU10_01325 [Nocardioides agariphilus]|uniref:Uncharacterized protein n=1 Tax=Nocardioides agariphilus TaxID=433664 RepID=A0A930VF71_9ACTN|nr:hypothetical protein [Nocardioides agariphilus]MBF4766404.1 hypothetical protein [Nocardioides agariphilus]